MALTPQLLGKVLVGTSLSWRSVSRELLLVLLASDHTYSDAHGPTSTFIKRHFLIQARR
jgi:hypothetical protein